MDDCCSFGEGSPYQREDCNQQCIMSNSSSDKPSSGKNPEREKIKEVYLKALEDLVQVNSLFSVAVFIGLSNSSPRQPRLGNQRRCDPDDSEAKTLVMYEVLSFAFFLLSSLAAKSLKVLINIYLLEEEMKPEEPVKYYFSSLRRLFQSKKWRRTILLMSTASSAVGVFFQTLSMFSVVQIKLGNFSCGGIRTSISLLSLSGLVVVSLTLYLTTMHYAVFVRFRSDFEVEFDERESSCS